MPFTDQELAFVKVKARPVNYGINQVSIGVADSYSNSSILSTSYTNILVTRSINGEAKTPKSYSVTSAGVISTAPTDRSVYTFTIGSTAVSEIKAGSYIVVKSNTYDNIYGQVFYQSGSTFYIAAEIFTTSFPTTLNTAGMEVIHVPAADVVYMWNKTANATVPAVTTQLGVDASYHIFDSGYSTLSTVAEYEKNWAKKAGTETVSSLTPQGQGKTGRPEYQGLEATYSIYVYDSSWKFVTKTTQVFTKDYGWYRSIEKSVDKYGKLFYDPERTTTKWMWRHLPDMYYKNDAGDTNTDLLNFLNLFAFYFDTYRTAADTVFSKSSVKQIDVKLLKVFLNQLGFDFSKVGNDPALGKKILSNLLRAYKTKGTTSGINTVVEATSGYNATVATTRTNLIPDNNASNFLEGPYISRYWTGLTATNTVELDRTGSPRFYSTNTAKVTNGMLRVRVYATQVVGVMGAPRFMVTATDTGPASPQTVVVNYHASSYGDYVLGPETLPYIPFGTYITGAGTTLTTASGTTSITLSENLTGTVPAGTVLYVTKAGPDKASLVAKMVPVTAGTRYTSSFWANPIGNTFPNLIGVINWYKSTGEILTVSTAISNATVAGGVVTITSTNHGFLLGQYVTASIVQTTGGATSVATVQGITSSATTNTFQVKGSIATFVSGTATGPINSTGTSTSISGSTTWTQVLVSATAPTSAEFATPGFITAAVVNAPTTNTLQLDAFQFEAGDSATTYVDPIVTSVTLTAVNSVLPYTSESLSRAIYNLKDFTTSGFIPNNNLVSTTYTVVSVTSVGPTMQMPSYRQDDLYDYQTATIVLSTATSNISVGQTFSLPIVYGTTDRKLVIDHGMIIGVISSTEYRIVRRDYAYADATGTTVGYLLGGDITATTPASPASNNLFINNPNLTVVATAAV